MRGFKESSSSELCSNSFKLLFGLVLWEVVSLATGDATSAAVLIV